MKKLNLLLSAFAGVMMMILSGCDPEEKIPAYLTINDFYVQNLNPAKQGSNNSNIKDAWVYIDGNLLGIFELPARFPVLAEGKHNVVIGPGIYENGISATRIRYPLYTSYEATVDLIPGQTVSVPDTLPINYFTGLEYSWYEDFEGNAYTFDSIQGSTIGFTPFNNDDPFEGNYSGKIFIDEAHSSFLGATTSDAVDINSFGTAWLEINYKAEQRFNVGLRVKKLNGSDVDEYALTINASAEWNKVYINVSNIVGSYSTAQSFKVTIQASLAQGRNQSTIYIDNLKLIHN